MIPLVHGSYEPTWNPLYRLGRHALEHWPEYLEVLQNPALYGGLAAIGAAGYGGIAGARACGRYLGYRPGDVVLGRRITKRRDLFLRTDVVARWADRTHHTEVVGPTGSGKTTALLPIAVQDLLRGHAVLVEEIYGDFGTRLIPYAIALGRPLFVFDPSLPGSLSYNPLAGTDDEDVVEDFASVVEGLFNYHEFYGPFNGDAARAFARLAREYARTAGAEADLALFGQLLTDRDFLYRVLNVRTEGKGREKTHSVGARWASRQTRSWFDSDYLRWGEDLHIRYLMGLKNWVRKLLSTEAARRALCPGPNGLLLDLEAALAVPGALVVLRAPVEAVKDEPAHAIARFLTRRVQDVTLRRLHYGGGLAPPLALSLDELPTLVGQGFGDAHSTAQWMALVRKCNVAVIVTYQGGALIGEVLEGALDTNARSKLFGPGLGAEDALRAQRALGYEEKEVTDERITTRGPLDAHGSHSRGRRKAHVPRHGDEELRFAPIGHWSYLPFKDRRQRPPERVRMIPVPPPARFANRAA